MRKLGHKALSLLATGALGLAGAAAFAAPASAATNATGTENVTLTAGSLSVGSVGSPVTLTAGVGGATAIGSGPTALYQDATGSGTGWNATAGVGSFTFNGPWVETQGAQALAASTSAYSGTTDGVTYIVTVSTGGTVSNTPFTWTSNDPSNLSGSVTTDANGTAHAVGTNGIMINFTGSTLYSAGNVYAIKVGAMPSTALATGLTGTDLVTPQSGTEAAPPVQQNLSTNIPANGTAVKFVSAAAYTGMGAYVISPGLVVTPDASAWAGTYSATLTYSIVTGP
jgi:hypothetical protein